MSSVSFTIVKPYKNKLVAMNKRQEKEMKKENENFKKSTKKTKKNKTKRMLCPDFIITRLFKWNFLVGAVYLNKIKDFLNSNREPHFQRIQILIN